MEVTVIIPNYNGKHFMEPCLRSLERQSFSEFRILVIDNCSTDGSQEYMRVAYPEVEFVQLDKNYGFSHAVNEGIIRAETAYVILLNNDTIVEKHFVEELLCAIKKKDSVFSVSSKMIQLHHPDLIDSAGDLYTAIGWGICRGAGRSVDNFRRAGEVFSACAGAAIYKRQIFEEIGYFDEIHFAYLEDIDVGYRAQIYGYRNMFCPTAQVRHVGSGTSGSKYNSFKVKLSARNSIYLNYKNMPALQLALNFLPLLLGYIVKYIFFCKKGFEKDYREGICEGLRTRKKCCKVAFKWAFFFHYVRIEWKLLCNTLTYACDWGKRKLSTKEKSVENKE